MFLRLWLTGGSKLHRKHLPNLMAGEFISGHEYWTCFTSCSSARTVARWLLVWTVEAWVRTTSMVLTCASTVLACVSTALDDARRLCFDTPQSCFSATRSHLCHSHCLFLVPPLPLVEKEMLRRRKIFLPAVLTAFHATHDCYTRQGVVNTLLWVCLPCTGTNQRD